VLKVLVVDVLFQARILRDRKDPLAYSMHLLIFFGFLALLLFHALGQHLRRLDQLVRIRVDAEPVHVHDGSVRPDARRGARHRRGAPRREEGGDPDGAGRTPRFSRS